MSDDLSEIDNQFFLNLYRCAVKEYRSKIEKRTGVALGEIAVRDYRQIDEDIMEHLQRLAPKSWWRRLFRRPAAHAKLKEWREHLDSTHTERAQACMASYFRRTIYVSFAQDIRCHEGGIAFAVVHELAHALWEQLEGIPLDLPRKGSSSIREKFRLLVEGHATYAEQKWFFDMYPKCVRDTVWQGTPATKTVHYRGMQRLTELVDQHGEQVLLEIPK